MHLNVQSYVMVIIKYVGKKKSQSNTTENLLSLAQAI